MTPLLKSKFFNDNAHNIWPSEPVRGPVVDVETFELSG